LDVAFARCAGVVARRAPDFGDLGFAAPGLDAFSFDAFGLDAFGLDAFGFDAFGLDAFGLDAFGFDAVRPDAVRPDAVRPDAVLPDAFLPDAVDARPALFAAVPAFFRAAASFTAFLTLRTPRLRLVTDVARVRHFFGTKSTNGATNVNSNGA
jgi:hypothetical protein